MHQALKTGNAETMSDEFKKELYTGLNTRISVAIKRPGEGVFK
jgi:hypothetical protein